MGTHRVSTEGHGRTHGKAHEKRADFEPLPSPESSNVGHEAASVQLELTLGYFHKTLTLARALTLQARVGLSTSLQEAAGLEMGKERSLNSNARIGMTHFLTPKGDYSLNIHITVSNIQE